MGDGEFIKLYICACNGWNPLDEAVKNIPISYWLMAFQFDRFRKYQQWEELYQRQGELIGHIANPEAYKIYAQFKRKREIQEKQGNSLEIKVGDNTFVQAGAIFDPAKGLVDIKTKKVLVSKDKYLSILKNSK